MLSSDEKAAHYRQQAAALRDMAGLRRSDTKLKEQLIDLPVNTSAWQRGLSDCSAPQEAGSPATKAAPSGLFVS